jgi:REP element-mobilizing transposase RayT
MPDHVHMCVEISPKHPVTSVIGFLKGKSAIAIARLSHELLYAFSGCPVTSLLAFPGKKVTTGDRHS